MIPFLVSLAACILLCILRRAPRRAALTERERQRTGRYVYVIANTDARGKAVAPIKVGIAKDPGQRLRTFQTANPRRLRIYRTFRVTRAQALEQAVHRHLHPFRMKGEWFAVSPEQAVTAVHVVLDRPRGGIGPAWQRLKLRVGLRRGRALAQRAGRIAGAGGHRQRG